jgi:hypothetical protein
MDSDPDPAIFVINIEDAIKKLFFLVFLLITGTFWKSKRSHKTVGIKVFLNIFA